MLHPSYVELMEAINKNADNGDEPVVTSRYSVVIAAAKRARQLIEHSSGMPEEYQEKKALSVAVEELLSGNVKILPSDEFEFEYEDMDSSISGDTVLGLSSYEEDEEEEETEESAGGDGEYEDNSGSYMDDDFDEDAGGDEEGEEPDPEEFEE